MITLEPINPINTAILEEIGFVWHTDADLTHYVADELVIVRDHEAEAYYEAVNELYTMYTTAAQHVIDNNLFFEIGIPFNLVECIQKSWENDVHWHLYGRFDLAGGIDGKPIKLIEFNADTPTALFETAILQWALLKHNNIDEARQFNNVYEAISDNFRRLVTLFEEPEMFERYYEGWKILFSADGNYPEEEHTVRLLQQMAIDAGFETEFEPLSGVKFDEEGIYDSHENPYEYWFKLYPWENIAIDENELATLLTAIMRNQKAIILNPAYTLLFQSKGMMKILWDLFPDSPYLLKTSYEPLKGIACVEKRMFGREGANVRILDHTGKPLESTDGAYENFKPIYQEYVEFPQDARGNSYQAGVFFAYEACGLGFRRGGKILNNGSKFVGHRLS